MGQDGGCHPGFHLFYVGSDWLRRRNCVLGFYPVDGRFTFLCVDPNTKKNIRVKNYPRKYLLAKNSNT